MDYQNSNPAVSTTDLDSTQEADAGSKTASREPTDQNVYIASSQEALSLIPRIKAVQQGDVRSLQFDCADLDKGIELLMKATGAEDPDFLNDILRQLYRFCMCDGEIDEIQLNEMISTIRAQKPRNQSEALVALQMSVTLAAAMKFGKYVVDARTIEEINCFGALSNKLMRTFAGYVEVLQRGRSDGDQKTVTVQNVSVREGGQAIVGNVTQNTSDDSKDKVATIPAAITDARVAPMPVMEDNPQLSKVPVRRRARR